MRFLCKCSYKGTAYQGWQKQAIGSTVQEEIEKVLSQYFNSDVQIQGSGRTDAGVHALEQTFHFDLEKDNVDEARFLYSINQMLPNDISITSIETVNNDFHARFSAKEKEYIYLISTKEKDPFAFDLSYNCLLRFDHEKFAKAITYFKGEHNYKNFTSKEEDENDFVRYVYNVSVVENDGVIRITFNGNGFMRYMIRYMVGTALACAQDKISLEEIKNLLDSSDENREIVSFKAPPEGLYLSKVKY